MCRFAGKVVLVTGSTAGIGRSIAERFCKEGAAVIVCSRKSQGVETTMKILNCDGVVCNVSVQADREALTEYIRAKHGKLDVLVLNAATSLAFGTSEDCDEARWDKMMDTNVKSAWLLSKCLVALMPEITSSITLISSFAAFNPDMPIGVYGVTKTSMLGLTRLLANEYGRKYRIRVNCVAPGVIKTKFSKGLWETDEVREVYEKSCPLSRVGEAEEVAGPVVFLASTDASYISGECIVVAGGTHCRL